ncbi:MAG TPA: hypothetical protein ENJ89_07305, partial [Caldithrix abyssi]|nr:hypothetical protein [Caldithrix abyssi]
MKRLLQKVFPLSIVALLFFVSGCTLLFLGGGAVIDHSNKREIITWKVTKINPGTKVTIIDQQDNSQDGVYIGFRLQKKEKYAQRYQQARQNLKPQTALPAINQTIHLVLTDGKEETGLLQSFGYDRLYVTTPETGKRRVILFAQLQAIRSEDGAAIDTETLQTLIRSHKIPVQYLLQFRVGDRIKTIYPEDIKYVRYTHTPNTGKIAGLLAGIAVDGLIVLSLQQAPAETSTQEGG